MDENHPDYDPELDPDCRCLSSEQRSYLCDLLEAAADKPSELSVADWSRLARKARAEILGLGPT